MMEDAALLRRYAEEKSEEAFAELVRRHLDLVYSTALRQLAGDTHLAQDVAQSVFTALARKAPSLTGHAALTGWLYLGAHHAAAQAVRGEQRRRARESEASTMHEILSSSAPATDWDRVRPVLDEAMRQLKEPDREAVLLRYFERRPFADIGVALEVTEDAARMRVDRALEKLRALLARRGISSTAAALTTALANQAMVAAPAGLAATVTAGAVAGVSAGGGITLAGSALTFMSTSKIVMGVAAVIAAIGIGGAIYEANIAEQATTELAALRQQHEAAKARAAGLEIKLRSVEQNGEVALARSVTLEKELELAKKSAVGAVPHAAATSASSMSSVWSNPAYTRLEVEKFRSSLGLRYGPLYRALNLAPEQIAKLEAALTEGQQGVMDIWATANAQGVSTGGSSPTSTSLARMTSGPLGAAQEAVRALLGEDGYQQFRQFDRGRAARELVASLAGNVYYSETPLTAQQGDALAGILSANTKTVKTQMADDGKTPVYSLVNVTDWDAVNAQAQGMLSSTQLATLQSLAEQARIDRELRQSQNAPAASAGKQPGG